MSYILILFFIINLFSCSERNRNNIFDPGSDNDVLEINLDVTQLSDRFKVTWDLNEMVDIDSIYIYKQIGDESNFTRIARYSSGVSSHNDNDIFEGIKVSYSASLQSNGIESSRCKAVERVWGPGSINVLSFYGYAVYEFTFDLKETKNIFYTSFPNQYFDRIESRIYLSNSYYGSLSYILVGSNPSERLIEIAGSGPFHYFSESEYILMGTQKTPFSLYKLSPNLAILDSVESISNPVLLVSSDIDENPIIVTRNEYICFDQNFNQTFLYMFPQKTAITAKKNKDYVYLGLQDTLAINTQLARINMNNNEVEELFGISGNIFAVKADTIWAEDRNGGTKLVKHLIDGTRLLNVENFINITEIEIHDQTNYIYVIERYSDTIYLINKQGQILTRLKDINSGVYDPINIKIQL